jgi:hypothetical protein
MIGNRSATQLLAAPFQRMSYGALRQEANRGLVVGVSGVLAIVLLLPMWWWPLVASQDGPSHLYNAAIINECLAGQGPSSTFYEVGWSPLPNWAGSLLAMVLLKILPLSIVPCVMLSITGAAPVLATLCLRRQIGRRCGFLWTFALAGCLATGRAWVLGFESFCLGTAAAIGVIALYERYRERLGLLRSLAIAGLLTLTFFCHLVPWAFAAGTIGALSFTGPAQGRSQRFLWTGAILLAASPWLLIYWKLNAASRSGLELDWQHLEGFHPFGMRSWLTLLGRADCINVMSASIPFTASRVVNNRPGAAFWTSDFAYTVFALILVNPMVLMTAAVAVQALRTANVELRSKDYRRIGWLAIGLGGILLALFMPDGTGRTGNFVPFRLMLLSFTMLIVYVRFDAGRVLTIATGLLVALGIAFHAAAVWDYAATANRQLLETREAAATIPAGRRLYQIGTKPDLRFRADPVLHSDGYVALWSRGVLLSNYEAARYYFPVKLRPTDPQSLVQRAEKLQSVDLKRGADRVLVQDFLSAQKQYIDVLIVRTVDRDLISLAQRSFSQVLWRTDGLCVLTRKHTANDAQPGQ